MESPDAATNDPDTFILNDSPQSFDPRGRLWTERTVVRLGAVRPRPTVEVPTSPDAPSPAIAASIGIRISPPTPTTR